ncbi:MAG TPA: N-acetylglucosamine-6-phosphate deacetylase [Thermomonas sp.]|uniref:N-acetylglucosamine-6-phosphate deacetylase n=1 Tax=Thermomonas sp. TaxID=1971895 RepID=UPI002C43ED12|nr:N-acetylglucosamine-6-phosphate deacetylase [Thermomonas sp.]HOZ23618.1 N-acetylglucosamine-6-phosphate deacetylase [Thermomonas sp.]HPM57126.1 N-acetylglucosamine-6-phosphate deacetylase [Thermomonas sp.]HPW13371.1 N-acetylglucosamine-6-phosphate deacetylase [Thermomonas sp.]
MTTHIFHNGHVLTERGFERDACVVVEEGFIVAVLHGEPPTGDLIDLDGGYLVPGFIDAQVNGGGGVLFNNDTSVEAIAAIGRAHRRFGTAGFLPTLISDDAAVMQRAIKATHDAIGQGVPGVLGIHLEGPYLAPARKGTHDDTKFRVPDADEIAMATSLDNGVSLITLAPEQVPPASIRAIVERGGIVAAGHTAGSYDEIRAGIDAGITGFTHLYNAMTPLQGREPGAVGAALEDDDCWCGVIVDGVHVHPASLRVALKAKPRGKVFLVTDAMPMVGADDPSFDLYGETIIAVDGVVRNAAGALAGSALDMASAVRNSVHLLGLPLDEACRMAAQYPAEFLGIGGERGRIAAGYRADLVLLDGEVRVQRSWIGGWE